MASVSNGGVIELERKVMIMETIKGKGELGLLTPLFEARLQYQSDKEVVVPAETREGELVGSGDGTVMGDVLSGKARWSMYAGNCAYVFVQAGVEPPPGQDLCTVHPSGVIATDDGAEVWFDARGYGLRGADQSHPHLWVLTMAVQFQTTDQRYQWLNTTLGVLVSEFDERAGLARWQAFVPKDAPVLTRSSGASAETRNEASTTGKRKSHL
jgi:hypothetical protein